MWRFQIRALQMAAAQTANVAAWKAGSVAEWKLMSLCGWLSLCGELLAAWFGSGGLEWAAFRREANIFENRDESSSSESPSTSKSFTKVIDKQSYEANSSKSAVVGPGRPSLVLCVDAHFPCSGKSPAFASPCPTSRSLAHQQRVHAGPGHLYFDSMSSRQAVCLRRP